MKIRIPSTEVEACDVCERRVGNGILEQCVCCGKEYCHICEAIMLGCMHQPEICKLCAKKDSVTKVVDRFAIEIRNVLERRDKAMKSAAAKDE